MPYSFKDSTGKVIRIVWSDGIDPDKVALRLNATGYELIETTKVAEHFPQGPVVGRRIDSPHDRIKALEKEKEALYEFLEEKHQMQKGELMQMIKEKLNG